MAELPDLDLDYLYEPATSEDETGGITLLLVPHAGADEAVLAQAGRRIAPGAALLAPRQDPAAADADGAAAPGAEQLHRRAGETAGFVAAACEALPLDPGNVWALGFSDGATATAALVYDHPDALVGAFILSGRSPFPAPKGRVLDGMKIFCASGRSDESVTMDDYEELVEALVTAGAEVELHWYDAGHELCDAELDDAARWLRKRLAPS